MFKSTDQCLASNSNPNLLTINQTSETNSKMLPYEQFVNDNPQKSISSLVPVNQQIQKTNTTNNNSIKHESSSKAPSNNINKYLNFL